MIDSVKVGNKIASLRKDSKMTQDDLASKLFVTRQNVSKWELGLSYPSVDSLVEMSKIFHVTIEDILCIDERETLNEKNIFEGHSREYVVVGIINGDIHVDLSKVFFQFNESERLLILKKIKEGKLKVNSSLMYVLSEEERAFLNRR